MRDNTIRASLGANPNMATYAMSNRQEKYVNSLPKGNLLQMASLSLQIALAYGEPEFLVTARVPQQQGFAKRLSAGLNRMAKLLDLGEIAREVAADSFYGYGIYKCGLGRMPASARAATDLEHGPNVWRVSQDDFLYDITASNWRDISYVGDLYTLPLNEAQEMWPQHADRLSALTDVDRLDSPHVMPRPSRYHSPEEKVWLYDCYFPSSQVVATWPVRAANFGMLQEEPLGVEDYIGHWSGVYQVLSHLYSPDELVPVAQAESVKALHFLFNDLLHLTSEQARHAKVNPMYKKGAEKDMQRLWEAGDRKPVGVVDPTQFAPFTIPGPSQDQSQYMMGIFNLFNQFVPSIDEPQRAPTATQGQLLRETTNATIAEARRKFNRALQQVGYKLGYMLINNQELVLPGSEQLRSGSKISVDMTWKPEPRNNVKIDEFEIGIEPFSTIYRTPEERLQRLNAMAQQVVFYINARAQGAPISVQEVLDTFAELGGEPRIKDWYEEVDPLHTAQRSQGRQSAGPRPGVGQYTRTNVSEKTNAGAMEQNFGQIGAANTPARAA